MFDKFCDFFFEHSYNCMYAVGWILTIASDEKVQMDIPTKKWVQKMDTFKNNC